MRKMNLLMLATLAVCMAACGGKGSGDGSSEKKDAITLKTEVQKIGDFANYASFPDEMKIKLAKENADEKTGEDEKKSTVNLILLESLDVHTAVCTDGMFDFVFNIVDEDYGEITSPQSMYYDEEIDLGAKYVNGKRFSHYFNKGIMRKELEFTLTSQEWEDVLNKGKYIIIKPSWSMSQHEYKTYGDSGSFASNDDSEDWDSILDQYEKLVDKSIMIVGRAANGDVSAASEYSELMEEANELSDRISNAKLNLSSSQMSRYTRIVQKAADAAQQMQ